MGLPRGTVGKDQDMWHYGHQRGFNEGERECAPILGPTPAFEAESRVQLFLLIKGGGSGGI